MSKFSLHDLEKHVFPFVGTDDPDVILGAAFGEDVALTRIGDDVLVSHVDPIIGAIGNIGWLAVHVACNDIVTSGVPPRWILLLVLVPTKDDMDLLEQIMNDVNRGGVLETLLEIALLSNVGISIDANRVPISPIVSQFAGAFRFDPLKMISSGTLTATVPLERMSHVTDSLREAGVLFTDVGRVTDGVGVLLLRKDGKCSLS